MKSTEPSIYRQSPDTPYATDQAPTALLDLLIKRPSDPEAVLAAQSGIGQGRIELSGLKREVNLANRHGGGDVGQPLRVIGGKEAAP